MKVSVRVNVDRHNLAGMRDLVADFAERGLVDETRSGRDGFSYYFKATEGDEGSDWCVSEREILDELLHMGFSVSEAIEQEGQYLMFARALRRILRKESLPPIQTAFCGAETGTAVVDPFGRLFTCIDRVTHDDAVVGRLNEEEGCFDWSLQRAKWRTRTSDLLRRCQTCPYVFACQGGCASQAKRVHGTYFREACGSMSETFDYVAPMSQVVHGRGRVMTSSRFRGRSRSPCSGTKVGRPSWTRRTSRRSCMCWRMQVCRCPCYRAGVIIGWRSRF